MDQTTHNVRRANWLAIITQCQERAEGISVKQWLSDNGVKEKAYYYWLQKFRKEAYAQMQSPGSKENPGNEIAFTEILIPAKTVRSVSVKSDPAKPLAARLFALLLRNMRT